MKKKMALFVKNATTVMKNLLGCNLLQKMDTGNALNVQQATKIVHLKTYLLV